jgi:HEAT repeat protein
MRSPLFAGIILGIALTAHGETTELPPLIVDALTPIDAVPSSDDLNHVFGTPTEAVTHLALIASDPNSDPGVQLRAIRALAQYKSTDLGSTAAHDALVNVFRLQRYATAKLGADLLVLRGVIEALGACPDKQPTDVDLLVPMLEHQSRDIRAATASALRDLGNTNAITPLSDRLNNEQVDQVKIAISKALRVLRGIPP